MLKTEKLSNDRFQFKNTIIFKFIFLGIAGFVAGYFMIHIGIEGNWQEMNEETVALGIGILAVIGGICSFILGPQTHTFIFDKAKNRISHTRKKLTGTKKDSYPLDEVEKIVVTMQKNKSSGSNNKRITYHYNLLFTDDDLIKLASKQRKHSGFSRLKGANAPDEIEQLSQFLDVEIETVGLKESFNHMMDTISGVIKKSKEKKEKSEAKDS